MAYEPLSKVYYKDNSEYKSLYYNRFNGDNTVRLNFDIHGAPAFFVECADIHNLYVRITELDREAKALCDWLPEAASRQFRADSLIDEVIITNDIEGVNSTRREISSILDSLAKKNKEPRRFEGLVNKYTMMGSRDISLKTCADIRAVYDDLVLNEVAEDDEDNVPDGALFRKDVAEVVSQTQKVIHVGLHPEAKIIDAMEKALSILNNENIPYVERVAIFHYLFGYIHPFYDGNGRTSRFISGYMLSSYLVNLIGYRLSYTIKQNINEYYNAFKVCNDTKNKGDLTPFVIMFMNIIKQSLENLILALEKRKEKYDFYFAKIKESEIFEDIKEKELCFYLMQASLFSELGITKRTLSEIAQVSESTVYKRLQIIQEKGYLIEKQNGHAICYSLNLDKPF